METVAFSAAPYHPSSPRTGVSGQAILRMKNMILTGSPPQIYLQCYKGSANLSETIPTSNLSGTLSSSGKSITGTSTAFTTEIKSGDWFWAGSSPLMVDTITDDTHMTVYVAPLIALSGVTGKRLPVLFDINRQRGTLISGNAVELDLGTILATGHGTLRINGSVLSGDSMVLTGSPQEAIFDPSTGDYAVYPLGFDAPDPAPTLSDDAGGSQGMVSGDYSVRLTAASSVTGGEGNPGIRANVSLGTDGHQIGVDITGVTVDTAAGADAVNAYATQLGVVNVNQGPWNFVLQHLLSDGNTFDLDYLNAQIARQGTVEFDNDPPPDAALVALLQGYPQWISCYGKWGTAPGPVLVPSKPQNLEAAPSNWVVTSSPPETILDVVSSQARLYLPCPNTLQQAVYAPTGDPLVPPTQIRPFWNLGFSSTQQIVFVQDLLVGYPHGGPTRSSADVETAETQFLGAYVAEVIQDWVSPYVKCGWDADPNVNAVCFFQPAIRQNDDGWWETDVLIWGVNQLDWIGAVTLTSTARDMVVCSVATVNNELTFLAGGRVSGGAIQIDTFKWNQISGDEIDYYVAWELQAGGIVDRNKTIRAVRVNGKLTDGLLDLYGFDSEIPESLTDIEDGTGSLGSISLGSTANVETSARYRVNFPSNFMMTLRVSGTYNGSDEMVDRINAALMEIMPQGNRR